MITVKDNKHIKLSIIFGWLSKVITALIQFLSIPIVISYLNMSDYAIFTILVGISAWFGLADWGFGACIQNKISQMQANNENVPVFLKQINLFIILLVLIQIIIFWPFSYFLQYVLFHKLTTTNLSSLVFIVAVLYINQFVFSITYRIYFAIYRGYMVYAFQLLGSLTTLGVLLLVSYMNYGGGNKLYTICWAYLLPPALSAIISYLTIMPMRITNIVEYNFLNRIFNLILFAYATILLNIWPIVAEKFALKHHDEIFMVTKTLFRNIMAGVAFVVISTLGFIILEPLFIKIVLHDKIQINNMNVLLFMVYMIIRIWTDTFVMTVQALNRLKIFLVCTPIQALVNVILMMWLGKIFQLPGVLFGLILSYLLTVAWIMPYYYFKQVRELKSVNLLKL